MESESPAIIPPPILSTYNFIFLLIIQTKRKYVSVKQGTNTPFWIKGVAWEAKRKFRHRCSRSGMRQELLWFYCMRLQVEEWHLVLSEKLYWIYNHSIKAPVCQWVSLFVCLFPNSSETANPSDLKFGGMMPLGGMQNVLG